MNDDVRELGIHGDVRVGIDEETDQLELRFEIRGPHIDRITIAAEKPCGSDRERRHAPISMMVDLVFVFDKLRSSKVGMVVR